MTRENVSTRTMLGSCYCGNITFELDWPGSQTSIPVRVCGCGLCQKHRTVWTSHPQGCFRLSIRDENKVNRYRFGTKTADFCICRECGVMPIAMCSIDGMRYSIINAHAFDNVDHSEFTESSTNVEGETADNRLARRKKNWTPEDPGSSRA